MWMCIHTFSDDDVARANGGDGMVSETILHNVRVLAIGESIQKAGKEPVIGGSNATLELTPKQVEQIILAQKVGQLSLSLRSMADSKRPATSIRPTRDESHHRSLRSSSSRAACIELDADRQNQAFKEFHA